jgi:D,D-heptose 1,7-bisphosphate phosphatase
MPSDSSFRPATIRQAAMLVGGLGTRLGALTASTPKPILNVGGRPFLAWPLQELSRYGVEEVVLLTGHLSDTVRESVAAIAETLPRKLRIVLSEEPFRAGTGGAVFHARALLDDRFLLLNGDSWLDFNLATLLSAASLDGPDVTGRIVTRAVPDASRYGVVATEGDRVTAFAERPAPGTPGAINAGIYVFDRALIDRLTPVCSLEADIMPALAREGRLRATPGSGYFIDIGIPDDLARAQTELPHALNRPALFLDRDGTINIDHGWVGTTDRFEFIPGAIEAVRAATEAGWHVFVVTNQSGIARGLYTEAEMHALHAWMADTLRRHGGTIDDVRHCPFHPQAVLPEWRGASPDRKPQPGMILDLLRAWRLNPADCILVGDQPTDMQAAAAAGMPGHLFQTTGPAGGNLEAFVRPLLQRRAPQH